MIIGYAVLTVFCLLLVGSLFLVVRQRDDARTQADDLRRTRKQESGVDGVIISWEERERELLQQLADKDSLIESKDATYAEHLASERERINLELIELNNDYALRHEALERTFAERKREEARLTAERSRTALVAKIGEHFAPLLEGFPYNFKDARHVGELVDFIVYDGLEDGKIREVVFLEVKTKRSGGRVSNKRERMLRDAIQAGRVRYDVFVPDTNGAKDIDIDILAE